MESTVIKQVEALIAGETNHIANLANISALVNQLMKNINWVGFYLYEPASNQLVLGPFQGKPACIRINVNQGVCGTAFGKNEIQRIADVHQFSGHIACDPASQSELVIPFSLSNGVRGVFDLDAPVLDRFSAQDQETLLACIRVLENHPHSPI